MKKIVFLLLATTSMMFAQSGSELVKTSEKIKEVTEKGLSNVNNVSINTKEALQTTSNAIGTIYNDGKSGVGTVYEDSKDLTKQLYTDSKILGSKIEETLKSVAEGLKTTSVKAWEILVKQQLVWSLCYLFLTLLSLYSIYRFFNQWKYMIEDKDESGDIKESQAVLTLILGTISLASSIVSGIHFEQMITGFVNPEFGALRTLFEIIQNIK
jgi:hypothetical protein